MFAERFIAPFDLPSPSLPSAWALHCIEKELDLWDSCANDLTNVFVILLIIDDFIYNRMLYKIQRWKREDSPLQDDSQRYLFQPFRECCKMANGFFPPFELFCPFYNCINCFLSWWIEMVEGYHNFLDLPKDSREEVQGAEQVAQHIVTTWVFKVTIRF